MPAHPCECEKLVEAGSNCAHEMAHKRNKDDSLLRNESHEDSSLKTVLKFKVPPL